MSSFSLVVSYVNQIQDAELASNILKKKKKKKSSFLFESL